MEREREKERKSDTSRPQGRAVRDSFGSVQRAKFQGEVLAGGLAQELTGGGWDLESPDL